MAERTKIDGKLQVVMNVTDGESTKAKTFTYSRIDQEASDDALFAAGAAISSLTKDDLKEVRFVETYSLTAGV